MRLFEEPARLHAGSHIPSTVMAAHVAAIHFPEAVQASFCLWKMDGPDEPGHDEV
jgi:hypothetical protein